MGLRSELQLLQSVCLEWGGSSMSRCRDGTVIIVRQSGSFCLSWENSEKVSEPTAVHYNCVFLRLSSYSFLSQTHLLQRQKNKKHKSTATQPHCATWSLRCFQCTSLWAKLEMIITLLLLGFKHTLIKQLNFCWTKPDVCMFVEHKDMKWSHFSSNSQLKRCCRFTAARLNRTLILLLKWKVDNLGFESLINVLKASGEAEVSQCQKHFVQI